MAPVEFRAVPGGLSARPVSARAPVMSAASASGPVFGPADGLWHRSQAEVAHAWRVVSGLLDRVMAAGPRDFEDLSPAERYTAGVVFAAGWCLGVRPLAPLSGRRVPASAAQVTAELALAEVMTAAQGPGWESAAGVHAWLSWITGSSDRMVFRAG